MNDVSETTKVEAPCEDCMSTREFLLRVNVIPLDFIRVVEIKPKPPNISWKSGGMVLALVMLRRTQFHS